MRLIDADELLFTLEKEQAYLEKERLTDRSFGIGDAIIDLVSAPTVDAVEVVRCKDCKHMKYAIDKGKNGICAALGALIIMNENDYCSCGERREE